MIDTSSDIRNPAIAPVPRPFAREGLLERIVPYGIVAITAVLLVALNPTPGKTHTLEVASLFTVAAIGVAVMAPWDRLPRWAELAPPVLELAAIALLRDAGGAAGSGLATLFALPIVWVALYGERRHVVVLVALTTIAMVLPIVVAGAPDYPPSEWRRALLNVAIGLLVGFTINGLVVRLRQVTAREELRARTLESREAQVRAMVSAANDAIVSLTPDGRIVDVNPAALELFRADREALIGADLIASFAVPEEREFLRTGMARITVEQDATAAPRFHTELIRSDGERFPAEVSVGVVRTDDGEYLVHAFARDISQQASASAAAQQQLDDLGALLAVARELGRADLAPTVRQTICATALSVGGASATMLFEPDGPDYVMTASAGRDMPVSRVTADSGPSGIALVARTRHPMFSGRLRRDKRVSAALTEQTGARAGFWQPILGPTGTAGVLVAVWDEEMDQLEPRIEALLNILASHAEVALEMSTLVGRLADMARTDGLTGVANRRTFDETLASETARATRSSHPLTVVMLDLDHFKSYNDRHGHQAGDELLRLVAATWQRELRPSDLLARYGGEEFCAILPECDAEAGQLVASRLRAATPGGVTVSGGVATLGLGEDALGLVARADAALYAAKLGGRNQVVAA